MHRSVTQGMVAPGPLGGFSPYHVRGRIVAQDEQGKVHQVVNDALSSRDTEFDAR